jgi:hypothetical protein
MSDKKTAKTPKATTPAVAGVMKVLTPVDPNIAAKNYAVATVKWPAFVDASGALLGGEKPAKKSFIGKDGKIAFCDYQILRYQAKKAELIAGKPVSEDKLLVKIAAETARLSELQARLAALQGRAPAPAPVA